MTEPILLTETTTRMLSKMIDLTQQRQQILAHNLANANTSNYIRKELDFQTALTKAIQSKNPNTISNVQGKIVQDTNRDPRENGNNVEIAAEMSNLMENNLTYKLLTRALASRMRIMKKAIK